MSGGHKPIAPDLAPSPPPHAPTAPDVRRRCRGCGEAEHGSVGRHIACLEKRIDDLEAAFRGAREALHRT